MIEIVIFSVLFGGLVIGGLVADVLGTLPTAEQLQQEDRDRMQRWQKSQ